MRTMGALALLWLLLPQAVAPFAPPAMFSAPQPLGSARTVEVPLTGRLAARPRILQASVAATGTTGYTPLVSASPLATVTIQSDTHLRASLSDSAEFG